MASGTPPATRTPPLRAPATPDSTKEMYKGVIVSLVLAAITAVAAYYCLSHGFELYDVAVKSWDLFKGGALLYLGTVFTAASVANIVFAYCRATGGCNTKGGFLDQCNIDLRKQVVGTIFAPIIAIPFAVVAGIQTTGARR